jgi:phage tail-like protein
MPPLRIDATRSNPYKDFRFRIKSDGRYVAGITKVGGLEPTTKPVKHRAGGDVRAPTTLGRSEHTAITLEHGVTHDVDFEQWARNLAEQQTPPADSRRDVIIDVFNEAGQRTHSYHVRRCWVSEFQALPDLDANANAVAIEHIKLENVGWDRDPAPAEPSEP